MPELSVEITAKIKSLETALKRAEKDLVQFKTIADNSTKPLENIGKKGSKAMGDLKKGTANAVPTVTEFSRIIQDAPFGIQGVANNITQLTQNFGYLKQKTGSTSSALKLMLSTLSGPAGILLAISAVTSLMVAYSSQMSKTKKDTEGLTEATKGFIGTAKLEITSLNTLFKSS